MQRNVHVIAGPAFALLVSSLFLLGTVLSGCGGGGGGGAPETQTAPQIANLDLSGALLEQIADSAYAFPYAGSDGVAHLTASLDFFDPEGDIVTVRVEVSNGTSLTIPVGGPPITSGYIQGPIDIATPECGVFDARVWVVDDDGLASNELSVQLTVHVNLFHWTERTSPTPKTLMDVAWSGSQLMAVGYEGTIVSSDDGVDWAVETSGVTMGLNAVIWDGSRWRVIAGHDSILSSVDGATWAAQSVGVAADELNALAWSGSVYVLGGERDGDSLLLWSADATTWHEVTSLVAPNRTVTDIAWSGTRFVAATTGATAFTSTTTVLTSTDGVHWDESMVTDVSRAATSITWTGTMFAITAGSGYVYTSPDGFAWTEHRPETFYLLRCSASNGVDLVVGNTLGFQASFDGGVTWTDRRGPWHLQAIVWAGDKFVAVGNGIIHTTP